MSWARYTYDFHNHCIFHQIQQPTQKLQIWIFYWMFYQLVLLFVSYIIFARFFLTLLRWGLYTVLQFLSYTVWQASLGCVCCWFALLSAEFFWLEHVFFMATRHWVRIFLWIWLTHLKPFFLLWQKLFPIGYGHFLFTRIKAPEITKCW